MQHSVGAGALHGGDTSVLSAVQRFNPEIPKSRRGTIPLKTFFYAAPTLDPDSSDHKKLLNLSGHFLLAIL
jgi:hypothetical protein